MQIYYILTCAASLYFLIKTPTKMKKADNIAACIILTIAGPIMWPVYLIGYIKTNFK